MSMVKIEGFNEAEDLSSDSLYSVSDELVTKVQAVRERIIETAQEVCNGKIGIQEEPQDNDDHRIIRTQSDEKDSIDCVISAIKKLLPAMKQNIRGIFEQEIQEQEKYKHYFL